MHRFKFFIPLSIILVLFIFTLLYISKKISNPVGISNIAEEYIPRIVKKRGQIERGSMSAMAVRDLRLLATKGSPTLVVSSVMEMSNPSDLIEIYRVAPQRKDGYGTMVQLTVLDNLKLKHDINADVLNFAVSELSSKRSDVIYYNKLISIIELGDYSSVTGKLKVFYASMKSKVPAEEFIEARFLWLNEMNRVEALLNNYSQ